MLFEVSLDAAFAVDKGADDRIDGEFCRNG